MRRMGGVILEFVRIYRNMFPRQSAGWSVLLTHTGSSGCISLMPHTPTLTISIGRMAAAIGVPKRAENAALMPHMIMTCLSLSSKRKNFPIAFPILPPICRAAPSRPADPPKKQVRVSAGPEIKIKGAMRRGSCHAEWIAFFIIKQHQSLPPASIPVYKVLFLRKKEL